MTSRAESLLKGHISAMRDIAVKLRKENTEHSNNIALDLESRADEEETFLILSQREKVLL